MRRIELMGLCSLVSALECTASVAFTYIPSILLKVGLNQAQMAVTLGIAPLLCLFSVPYLGQLSDECKSSLGKRTPFIMVLITLVFFSLIFLLSLTASPSTRVMQHFVPAGHGSPPESRSRSSRSEQSLSPPSLPSSNSSMHSIQYSSSSRFGEGKSDELSADSVNQTSAFSIRKRDDSDRLLADSVNKTTSAISYSSDVKQQQRSTTTTSNDYRLYGTMLAVISLDYATQAAFNPCESLLADTVHGSSVRKVAEGYSIYAAMLSFGACLGYLICSIEWLSSYNMFILPTEESFIFLICILVMIVAVCFTALFLIRIDDRTTGGSSSSTSKLRKSYDKMNFSECCKFRGGVWWKKRYQNFCHKIYMSCSSSDGNDVLPHSLPTSPNQCSGGNRKLSINTRKTVFACFSFMKKLTTKTVGMAQFFIGKVISMIVGSCRIWRRSPQILRNLFYVDLFSWMAITGHAWFVSTFVAEFVYHLNVKDLRLSSSSAALTSIITDDGFNIASEEPLTSIITPQNLPLLVASTTIQRDFEMQQPIEPMNNSTIDVIATFDESVKVASQSMLIYSVMAVIFASACQQYLIDKVLGLRNTYLLGLTSLTISIFIPVLYPSIHLINLCAAFSGVGYAVITSVPNTLITLYHSNPKLYFLEKSSTTEAKDETDVGLFGSDTLEEDVTSSTASFRTEIQPLVGEEEEGDHGEGEVHGYAEDISIIDMGYYISQILVSSTIGCLVEMTGYASLYFIVPGICAGISTLLAYKIIVYGPSDVLTRNIIS